MERLECPGQQVRAVDTAANAPKVAAVTLDWPVKVGRAGTDTGGEWCVIRTGT
jgi:hypothetical protein